MISHDPLRTAFEIREQLASEKRRLVFFAGAGTSMAVGFPGIDELTTMVEDNLVEPQKTKFKQIQSEVGAEADVESVLDRIRIYCELIGDDAGKTYSGLVGSEAKELDDAVCKEICNIFCADPKGGMNPHLVLAQWIGALRNNRDWPVEIFTTNYDLLFEKAMETFGIPFFDGFIGSANPFFVPESIEVEKSSRLDPTTPPRGWSRLWKVHGSINWHVYKDETSDIERIVRLSSGDTSMGEGAVIFPSREKYQQSRKLPYIAFQDRFRRLLFGGECLLVILGYSFSDQHLNEIILQGLRSNPHLTVMALMFGDQIEGDEAGLSVSQDVLELGKEFRNLSIYGPDMACVGGIIAPWAIPDETKVDSEEWPFWNREKKSFSLGGFNKFSEYLEKYIKFRLFTTKEEVATAPIETKVPSGVVEKEKEGTSEI